MVVSHWIAPFAEGGIKLDAKCCWWIWGISPKNSGLFGLVSYYNDPCFQRFLDICCSPKNWGDDTKNKPVLTCMYFSALGGPAKTTNKPMKFHGTYDLVEWNRRGTLQRPTTPKSWTLRVHGNFSGYRKSCQPKTGLYENFKGECLWRNSLTHTIYEWYILPTCGWFWW